MKMKRVQIQLLRKLHTIQYDHYDTMVTRETTKHLLTVCIIIAAVVIVGGYSYFASSGLIKGPSITITSPTGGNGGRDGSVVYSDVSTSSIVISGIAKRVNTLTLDGRPIAIDLQGNFSQTVLLFPGNNTEIMQGQDRFGRTTQINFEIVYTTQ